VPQTIAKHCYSFGSVEQFVQVQPVLGLHPRQAIGHEESARIEFPGFESVVRADADAGHDVEVHAVWRGEAGEIRRGVGGSHLLIVVPSKRKKAGELGLARLYARETNNMTPHMIVLGV
jgi:hypothetical protein